MQTCYRLPVSSYVAPIAEMGLSALDDGSRCHTTHVCVAFVHYVLYILYKPVSVPFMHVFTVHLHFSFSIKTNASFVYAFPYNNIHKYVNSYLVYALNYRPYSRGGGGIFSFVFVSKCIYSCWCVNSTHKNRTFAHNFSAEIKEEENEKTKDPNYRH